MFHNYLKAYLTASSLTSQATRTLSLLISPLSSHITTTTTKTATTHGGTAHPKDQTLLTLFKHCSTMENVTQLHAHIIRSGLSQNLFLIGKIIVLCAVSDKGSMDYAVSVFGGIENPDGFLWNTMIRGFGRTCEVEKVFGYYKGMLEKGLIADNFTFSFLIKVSGQLGLLMLGKSLHCDALKHGLDTHVHVRNTLLHMYGKFKDIKTALQLFDEMPNSDLVAWNTMIDCHVNGGRYREALELFSHMVRLGVEPDEATLVVTLSACSALGGLDFGRWVDSLVDRSRLSDVVSVDNSLIDMYAKCGAIEEGYGIFERMRKRNVVSWNSMILGFAIHGHARDALGLFSRMLEEKLERPNDVTFLGVLCACSHGGMVEEGRKYFDVMRRDYRIEPMMKHYGAMVDMLGRAGFVEEAYQLIESMPIVCNTIVWRTLLAACRLHGNVELGKLVRRHLLELEPDHSSDYVLLANTYASAGQWNDAVGLRRSMRDRGVQKPKPGNSFIGFHRRDGLGIELKT